ncbi:uncharacterized protein FA14DRAFT_161059 [Meira miltonrushii]|uniref:Uncharacterized protein n=1 Tax=Meira miltonrushii TaxID=1280837 RepID=A0A316VIZ9_9BASI|nr:uncharacterized protein FA14DRAFT_161059 [Meira miltonrushii]PWN36273.1 hypothetical protein FA14DRAFT_161059 [Meira miltonrushii]
MFSWWSGPQYRSSNGEGSRSGRNGSANQPNSGRKVKMQEVQVEIIGGCRSGPMIPQSSRFAERSKVDPIIGPPKLPRELITQILQTACDIIIEEQKSIGMDPGSGLLRLARIDRFSHFFILSQFILPSLRLHGAQQVHAFARDLARNTMNIRRLASKIKRLFILRPLSKEKKDHSVFADVEETTKFEKATLAPLRSVLKYCTGLQYLALEMTARVLDLRWPDDMDKAGLVEVSHSLKELNTMLSLYGGDLNERLWDISYGAPAMNRSRWANLTHLQLHGPRFRMTSLTALALCDLPQLTHLALIMPWIVHATMNVDGISTDLLSRHSSAIERTTDIAGRQSVLQLLVSGLGHRLEELVLVCHDLEGYVGNITNLGPWFRALQWYEYTDTTCHPDEHSRSDLPDVSSNLQLTLITASVGDESDQQAHTHPNLISKWMVQRAQKQRHWTFHDGEKDTFRQKAISLAVESWKIPQVQQQGAATTMPDSQHFISDIASASNPIDSPVVSYHPNQLINSIDDLD